MANEVNIINPDPYCPVRLTQILNRGRHTDKFCVEVQKPDSDEFMELPGVATVHGADYALIPNARIHELAQDVMRNAGLAFQPVPSFGGGHSAPLTWTGKNYLERWYTPDVKIQLPTGSQVMLGIEVRNSYDKSCRAGLAFFAMHVACSNQFHGHNILGEAFSFRHTDADSLGDNLNDAVNQIGQQAENFAQILPKIKMLSETRVGGLKGFLEVRNRMIEQTGLEFRDKGILDELGGHGVTKKLGINVGTAYGDPDTYWALANAFTAITTHQVGGLRGCDHSGRALDFLLEDAGRVAA